MVAKAVPTFDIYCDDCFPGGEELTIGFLGPRPCCRCGKTCIANEAGSGIHPMRSRALIERGGKEQAIMARMLDLASELLHLNPNSNSLVLSRQGQFSVTIRAEQTRDTIPSPPPNGEAE